MVMSSVYLAAALAACHLLCQFFILIPGHISGWIRNACLIKKILVVEQHIPVFAEWKGVIASVHLKLLCYALIHSKINGIFLNVLIQI